MKMRNLPSLCCELCIFILQMVLTDIHIRRRSIYLNRRFLWSFCLEMPAHEKQMLFNAKSMVDLCCTHQDWLFLNLTFSNRQLNNLLSYWKFCMFFETYIRNSLENDSVQIRVTRGNALHTIQLSMYVCSTERRC